MVSRASSVILHITVRHVELISGAVVISHTSCTMLHIAVGHP